METLQVKSEPSSSNSSFYVWDVPGKPTVVHLDFAVVDRLLIEVMRGFGAIPRRGAEVGGILLGSAETTGDRTLVRIEEFEPVVCEHRRGPSYLLSETDTQRFEEILSRHRRTPEKRLYAVGCYRSHTREGMAMTAEDLKQFDSYFPDPGATFLMIKPFATRVSVAGFFIREGELVHTDAPYLEFPFRRRELGGGASPSPRLREPAPHAQIASHAGGGGYDAASAPQEDLHFADYPAYDDQNLYVEEPVDGPPGVEPEDAPAPARLRKTNVWIPLSFIFLLLGVLVGFQAALTYKPAKAAGVLSDPFSMSLAVSRSGDYLHVRWDRHSQPVRTAQRGVLTISEGGYDKKVDLDALQLQNPTVYYRNMSEHAVFRLDVYTKERVSVSETIEWRK